MVSLRNLSSCFVRSVLIIFIGLLAQESYGQAVSFDINYLSKTKASFNTSEFYKKGYTSELLALPEYRNIREKSRRLKHNIERRKQEVVHFDIGDEKEFFVRNILTGNTWATTNAVLIFEHSQVNIWIQKSAHDTLNATQGFQTVLNGFQELLFNSTSTNSIDTEKGVLQILNEYVGDFPNVDGDEVLDVLLLDIQDNFEETGSFVAGFFDPVNLFEFVFSNEMDLIYLDLYPTIFFNDSINVERAVSTFAHESQHLIHAGYEGEEPELVFINEGFSEAVEIICGFKPRSEEGYQKFPLRGLLSWNFENPLPDYSRASLWTHYLVEQLGTQYLKELVQNPEIGYNVYKDVVESNSPFSFNEFFHNWGVALTINDYTIRSEFGYGHQDRKAQILSSVIESTQLPNAFKTQFESLVHIPLNFPLTKELTIHIDESSPNTLISSFEQYPGTSEINIRNSNAPFITSFADRFNHGSIQALVSYVEEPASTENSTFSFLAEGEYSGRLVNTGYGDGSPDQFYRNASYLTLNSHDQKIGVVFPPAKTSYWLKELVIRTVFKSELEGSGIDGNEPRDFEIDIFTFKNGRPDSKIIPTLAIDSEREAGKLIAEAFSLLSFYDDLSAVTDSLIIILSNDEDDNNFVAIGMDEGSQNASFFNDNTNSNAWVSLADMSIGGNSLSNWNPIIRTNSVLPEVNRVKDILIAAIEYDFKAVRVEVTPNSDFDFASVKVIAKLPDGSFQNGVLITEDENVFSFSFPLLVNGSYTFISSFQSPDGGVTYTDERTWEIEIPDGFELRNNYPNPFNPTTTIPFILLEDATISWQIYDVLGRRVMETGEQEFLSGEHAQEFNMNGFASGMYIVRAKLDRERDGTTKYRTQKIMLIK